jgi:hypothetical protein
MIPVFFLGREMFVVYTTHSDMGAYIYMAITISLLFLFWIPPYEGISIRRQTRDFIDDLAWWYYLSLGLGFFYLVGAFSIITVFYAPLWVGIPALIYLIPGLIGLQFVEEISAERKA